MAKKFIDIKGIDLDNFIKTVKGEEQFKFVINELVRNKKTNTEGFTVLDAKKLQSTDGDVNYLTASLENDKARITFIKTARQTIVGLRVLQEENGVTVAKMYHLMDGRLQHKGDVDYDKLLEGIKQLEQSELPDNLDRSEVAANIPCIYGNWCGPGCSGPGAPISPVDTCCKAHDNCYASRGYFACSCDSNLLYCLWPYVLQGSEWAILVYTYFSGAPCNPFA
ncbi:MAG: hypothetical protein ACM3X7_06735 [Solirubrobacterales bacterium]